MNESFSAFVRVLTAVLWGPHVLLLILLAGVWFTLRGRFMQVTKLPGMTRGALCGTQRCGGFSAFQSLTASLAGSLGTGNILGVAAAILVGGAGAVVWMWIAAFFGMMTVYAEGVLAAKFGTKNAPGAIGYVQKAFGRHGAKIYAAGCVLSALGMGTMAQTGAASSVLVPMGVPRVLAGVVFAGLLLLCVRGGLPKAVRVTEKLVPFMAGLFLALCAAVLLLRGSHIPGAVRNMLKGAFSLKAGAGGVCGMILAMREGISRGVFTNEAGLGSGTFATFRTENKTPEQIVHSALCRCLSTQSCCAQLRRCACWCHPCVIFPRKRRFRCFRSFWGGSASFLPAYAWRFSRLHRFWRGAATVWTRYCIYCRKKARRKREYTWHFRRFPAFWGACRRFSAF